MASPRGCVLPDHPRTPGARRTRLTSPTQNDGSDGDWARLFASSDGFRGTELFRSLTDPGRYLTVDRFTDEGAWRAFMSEYGDPYRRLDDATKG
jgi:hypothetical protein